MYHRPQQSAIITALSEGKRQQLRKKTVIGFQSSHQVIGVLASGYVKRYVITEDGNHSIQALYARGDIFPLTTAYKQLFELELNTGQEQVYYETLCSSVLYTLSREELKSLFEEQPSLYQDLAFAAGIRLQSNIQKLENMSLKTADKRVSHQLLYLAQQIGINNGGSITFDIPLTHQLIANMLNMARETVSHSMGRLHAQGVIETDPHVTIPDITTLERLAYS